MKVIYGKVVSFIKMYNPIIMTLYIVKLIKMKENKKIKKEIKLTIMKVI